MSFFALLSAIVCLMGSVPAVPQEPGEIRTLEALFNLPLCYRLTPDVLDLYAETARSSDFVWLDLKYFDLVPRIPRGRIILFFGSSVETLALTPVLRSRAEYLGLGTGVNVTEAMNLAFSADLQKKKTALAPEGHRALENNAALTKELAPYADLFIIRAEHWLDPEVPSSLAIFVENVHAVAQAARSANPAVEIQIWLGQQREDDGLDVEGLTEALFRLYQEHPEDLQSLCLGRLDAWFNPQEGNNLLVQTLYFFRQDAYSPPGAPATPSGFKASAASPLGVDLTWSAGTADALGFFLKRGTTPGRPPARLSGFVSRPDALDYIDIVPSPGAYYYRLCAYNNQGISLFTGLQAVETRGGRPNLPPQFAAPPAAAVYRGIPVDLVISATDPDGDPLTYSLSLHPAGMIIHPETGMISWLPSATGRFAVSVTASDGRDADFLWFEVEVLPAGQSGA